MNLTASPPKPQPLTPYDARAIAASLAGKSLRVFRLIPEDKRPKHKGSFHDATNDLALITSQFQPRENVGVATGSTYGSGLVVLDFDTAVKGQAMSPRDMGAYNLFTEFLTGLVGAERAAALIGNALWVHTPGGGWQIYMRQEEGAHLKSRDHLLLSEGILGGGTGDRKDGTSFDTRGEGGYAVGPGSMTAARTSQRADGTVKHSQTAGTYQPWYKGEQIPLDAIPHFDELPVLPAEVIDALNALPVERVGTSCGAAPGGHIEGKPAALAAPSPAVLTHAPEHALIGSQESSSAMVSVRAPKYAKRIRSALSASVAACPARYGTRAGWLDVMTALAGAAVAGELTVEEADAIYEWFCSSTPGEKSDNEEQWRKTKELAQARLRTGDDLRGCKSILEQAEKDGWTDTAPATAEANPPVTPEGEWPGGVKRLRGGEYVPLDNALNAGALLTAVGFKARLVTRGYFHEVWTPETQVSLALPVGWSRLDDGVLRQLTGIVIKGGIRTVKLDTVAQGVKTLGDLVPHDPFRAMLETVAPWDGIARIEDFPSRYLGAQPDGLTAAWGKHFFMLLMARTYAPGCKADEMLILLGKQRTGKSTALRSIVGSDFFDDNLTLGATPQVVIETTQGKALVEISELQGLSGKRADKNKAMISRQVDVTRLAYGKATSTVPRSFILAGTANDMTPFDDPTGALRFMPITVGEIDVAGIERDRGQLLAEALYKFRSEFGGNASRVKLDPSWWEKAKEETEKYQNIDPWEDVINALLVDERERLRVWMDPNVVQGFFLSSNELLGRLVPPGYNKTGSHTKRLSDLMRRLGFEKVRPQIDGKRNTGFFRPFTAEETAWRDEQAQAGQPVDQGQGISLKPALVVV